MYIDYDYYLSKNGTIEDKTTFDKLNQRTEYLVDYLTFNRIKQFSEVPEKIKDCIVYIINECSDVIDQNTIQGFSGFGGGKMPASISNDGVSISYGSGGSSSGGNGQGNDLNSIIAASIMHTAQLAFTGVYDINGRNILYRGV